MRAVHPFPARMAPELVEARLAGLPAGRVLLDPMMGSGTFVLSAAARGHHAIGVDSDPLAHIITAAAAGDYDKHSVVAAAERVVRTAALLVGEITSSSDAESRDFIDFWFDEEARDKLAALADRIEAEPRALQPALWCAFSRLIITKDAGASRARDVSHSRPHRVRDKASFDPIARYETAVHTVVARAGSGPRKGKLHLLNGDARKLRIPDSSVDGIMTSPPYLIAIDYLRGHRLSLVWMGHTLSELRMLRGTSIGAERGSSLPTHLQKAVEAAVEGELEARTARILNTYVQDLDALLAEQARVLRPGGRLTVVVANASHGVGAVSVEKLVRSSARSHGLKHVSRTERILPSNRRYLPPPKKVDGGLLDQRMHVEVIVTFQRPQH